MQRLLSNEEIYELLIMRGNGVGYKDIGIKFGITHKQVSNQYRSVLSGYRGGYLGTVKKIAELSGEPLHEILRLLKTNIPHETLKDKPPPNITIKKSFSSKVWYANKIGKTFPAKKTIHGYWVNNNSLFNVKHNDCIEVTI